MVVIVTGATRGIGRATVDELLARGARVGCVARSPEELASVRSELAEEQLQVAKADVAVRAQVESALAELARGLGPPEVLVNNAGIGHWGSVLDLDADTAEEVMRVNYLGTVHATKVVLPGMLARRRGHIVNVASIAGRLGVPFEAVYAASKFAVVGFSESIALEVAPFGVKVSTVDPGPVATSFFESRGHRYERARPRPIPAQRVARAILEAVEFERPQQTVPRMLGAGILLRHLVPAAYRAGARRAFRHELADFAQEVIRR
jgi:short-subunit dehydrogenase